MLESLFNIFVIFQIVGSALGMIGSYLNKSIEVNTKIVAFQAWIVSNIVLLVWSISIGAVYIAIMYVFFLYTASDGLIKHVKLNNDNNSNMNETFDPFV